MKLRALLCAWLWLISLPLVAYGLPPPLAGNGDCNNFEFIQSVILSEATNQPLPTQIEVARVAVTKGACFRSPDFYAGYGVALRHVNRCVANWHCRAYFLMDTLAEDVRESAAQAAHWALTEDPRIARYHFDNVAAPLPAWWVGACDARGHDTFISGELRVC